MRDFSKQPYSHSELLSIALLYILYLFSSCFLPPVTILSMFENIPIFLPSLPIHLCTYLQCFPFLSQERTLQETRNTCKYSSKNLLQHAVDDVGIKITSLPDIADKPQNRLCESWRLHYNILALCNLFDLLILLLL